MSPQLIWDNVVAYSLQVGLLVGVAAFVPAALRLKLPRARLAYWHLLLVACLLLPGIQPWRRSVVAGAVEVTTRVVAVAPTGTKSSGVSLSRAEIALLVLGAGAAGRLLWLALGLWRLGRYRRNATAHGERDGCTILVSEEIPSPVTFGVSRPVILLQAGFPDLHARMQEAILCHELLHIERRDWLFTLGEEVVRAFFWFHPAIWWLLGEIQLAREQAVDREVVERTQAREEYVDALLTIAGATPQLDLAPAPLFLRKRHLKHRVVSILKEVRMSRNRLVSALAAGVGVLAAGCWFVTATFPLAASPQVVNDAPGVSVDVGGNVLLHRSPVGYAETARRGGIQGTVSVEVVLDAAGNVSEARVVSGPQELRRAVQQSVLQWHFKPEASGTTRMISVVFQAAEPQDQAAPTTTATIAPNTALSRQAAEISPQQQQQAQARMESIRRELEARTGAASAQRTLKSIQFMGLSDAVKSELQSRLPVREGQAITPDQIARTTQVVKEFDEHLRLAVANTMEETTLSIIAPEAPLTPERIRIGGNVQQVKLIKQPHPVYPPDAKTARIQGVVKLQVVIAKDGTVQNMEIISGHPLLVPAAMEAVKQWVYQPTLLNGNPVEVMTQIDVNFTLAP